MKDIKKSELLRLTQKLVDLEDEADRAAVGQQWMSLARLNGEIDAVHEELAEFAIDPDALLQAAKAQGIKPIPQNGSNVKNLGDFKKANSLWDKKMSGDLDDPIGGDLLDTGLGVEVGSAGKKGSKSSSKSTGGYVKCAHKHPLLKIKDPVTKKELTIQGGSCYSPQHLPYDIEIFLCKGADIPSKVLPWDKTKWVRYPIVDMSVPDDPVEFQKVIDWTIKEMRKGKKVHVGCIGGHGRTGIFLSLLVHRITGQKDSTAWLRKNYCSSAVESYEQIDWLNKHWGINKVKASKDYGMYSGYGWSSGGTGSGTSYKGNNVYDPLDPHRVAIPIKSRSVWGNTKLI